MKTAIIYDQCGEEHISFYVIDGDYSKFDGVYVNSCDENADLQHKLCMLLYDKEGRKSLPCATKEELCKAISEGAKLITCGFIP